jgi:RNA polymerase sigma-70 factor (ECF subfamily)
MLTTSQNLLERLREKESNAWAQFVRLYTPLLMAWTRRQAFQEADAQDVAQEVLVKLVRELPAYKRGPGQSFRGWLRRVTLNQGRDFRRRKANRALPGAEGLSLVSDDPADTGSEETADRRLLVRRGLELIRADFNDTTWAAFTRLMMDGRPAAAVAAEFNISANAVYLARHRVLTRLRQELDGLLD